MRVLAVVLGVGNVSLRARGAESGGTATDTGTGTSTDARVITSVVCELCKQHQDTTRVIDIWWCLAPVGTVHPGCWRTGRIVREMQTPYTHTHIHTHTHTHTHPHTHTSAGEVRLTATVAGVAGLASQRLPPAVRSTRLCDASISSLHAASCARNSCRSNAAVSTSRCAPSSRSFSSLKNIQKQPVQTPILKFLHLKNKQIVLFVLVSPQHQSIGCVGQHGQSRAWPSQTTDTFRARSSAHLIS